MAPTAPCPDCSSPAAGRYCATCGVRLSGRLTAGTLAGEFFARFFGAESGLWPTLLGLLLHPGRTARAYLDGRRRRLLSPLALIVLGATTQMVGLWLLRDLVTSEVIGSLPQQYFDVLQKKFGIAEPREWATGRYLGFVQAAYSWLGILTLALPLAGVARLVMGRAAHFTEIFAVTLYTVGFSMLATAIAAQGTMRVSVLCQSVVSIGIYLSHSLASFVGCFGWRPRVVTAALAGLLVGLTLFVLSIGTLAGLSFDPRFWR